jgi:HEAT repeat protein
VETKKSATPRSDRDGDEAAVSPAQINKVRELIHVLANAIHAARLFPADHQTVVNFISDLHERLSGYLDKHGKLEIWIEEQAFTFAGKRVHEDLQTAKSLPFFFFKDGMQSISFYKGIEKDELKGFLETIRAVSALPPEEGDIVNALWERDFANIRYLAPDDYLETKIGLGRPPLEWKVDRQAMETGRIDLSPEDLEDVRNRVYAMEHSQGRDADTWGVPQTGDLGSLAAPSTDSESQEIETMLAADREISAEDEYLNLLVEVIYLEDRGDEFSGLADVIRQYHGDLISRGDFVRASRLLRSLIDLRDALAKSNSAKAAMLSGAFQEITGKAALVELEESLRLHGAGDDETLFCYLGLIGPAAARLIAELFERAKTQSVRALALEALKNIGREDTAALMLLPQESKPALTKEIIGMVTGSRDKRIISFLAGFLSYRNASVRLEAVRALGRAADDAADKILVGFLSDSEEPIRIATLEGLRPNADRQVVRQVLDRAGGGAGLKKKSAAEREALMAFLGRSRSEDACAWLRRILGRTPFLPDGKHTEICVAAAAALANLAYPEAREALQKGSRKRQRKIREACLTALEDWPKTGKPTAPSESSREKS